MKYNKVKSHRFVHKINCTTINAGTLRSCAEDEIIVVGETLSRRRTVTLVARETELANCVREWSRLNGRRASSNGRDAARRR